VRDIAARRPWSPGHREQLRGAVMFVDLAGFTPLVMSLCAAGQRGIETLQGILTSYFGKLIEGIYAHGGDVYGFAGDAMLVGFSAENGESDADVMARAVTSATRARADLAAYENLDALGEQHRMQLKFGLSFGDYHYLLLGHEDFWYTPLLFGRPVRAAIDAEHHAQGGEILVDRKIWSRLPSPKSGSSVNGFMKLQSVCERVSNFVFQQPLPDARQDRELLEDCAHFIEPVFFQQAITSHSGFSGDYREVTCLFARFADLPMEGDVEEALSRLTDVYRHVQESAKTYGAILNRIELADKGFVFLFILGAPVAMENKCTLAGRLALKLSQPPFSFPHRVHIGMATGHGYCGDVGAPQRKDYTVTGEVVNLAARLMTYAEAGGIYADTITRERFDDRLIVTDIPNVVLKGLPEPVTIARLHSETTGHRGGLLHFADRMVGRSAELSRLLDLHQETLAGALRICAVVGEPGLGKSRIAGAFLEKLPETGCRSHVGACYSHDQSTPYSGWKDLLADFLGISDTGDSEQARDRLSHRIRELDGVSPEWSPVLARIMGIAAEEEALTRNLEPGQKTRRVFQIILELIERKARNEPLVLCFDDVHWIDDVSLRLIGYLCQNLQSHAVFLLLLSRSREPLSALENHPGFSLLELGRLSSDASRSLLRHKLAHHELDVKLESQILDKAEGNPFYIEFMVRDILEQNVLESSNDGRLDFRPDSRQVRLPDTLQDLVLTRIDRLDEDQKTVLRIASVVGRMFEYELIKSLLPPTLKVVALGEILTRLESSDLVLVASNSPLTCYFKHVVIRDVVYETLPLHRREDLHKKIGRYYEACSETDVDERSELLAYHFLAGRELERGLTHTVSAGRRAAVKFANQDAVFHFTKALEILGRDEFTTRHEDRLMVREQLAKVYRQAGMYPEATNLFMQCLERPTSPIRRADIHIGLGHVYQEAGQATLAIEELEKALRLLGRRVPHGDLPVVLAIVWELMLRAVKRGMPFSSRPVGGEKKLRYKKQYDVLAVLGLIYFFIELKKTAWTVFNLLKVAERLQSPEELCLAYSNYAVALMGRGFVRRASIYCEKSLELAKEIDNPSILGRAYIRTGTLGIYTNDPRLSLRSYEKGVQIFKQIGGRWDQLSALGGMTAAYTLCTEFDMTDRLFSEIEEIATELDSKMHLAWAKCWRPFYRYLLGREEAEDARHAIRASIPFSMECNDTSTQFLANGHLCAIAVRENDAVGAAWLADETFDALWKNRARLPVRTPQMAWIYAAEAALFALERDVGEVPHKRLHAIVRRATAHVVRIGKRFPYVLGPGMRVQAGYRVCSGDAKHSRASFERAFEILEKSPDRWQTGVAYYDASRFFPERAEELGMKARDIFEAHELKAELRRLERLRYR